MCTSYKNLIKGMRLSVYTFRFLFVHNHLLFLSCFDVHPSKKNKKTSSSKRKKAKRAKEAEEEEVGENEEQGEGGEEEATEKEEQEKGRLRRRSPTWRRWKMRRRAIREDAELEEEAKEEGVDTDVPPR